jgi:Xaa-Pro aminopeptidase
MCFFQRRIGRRIPALAAALLLGALAQRGWADETLLSPGEYAGRRAKVLEGLTRDAGRPAVLLLSSPQPSRFAGDVEYPFRPDNDLLYLTGLDQEGVTLLIAGREIEGLGREVLFLPPPGPLQGVWITRRFTAGEASARSGIAEKSILAREKLSAILRKSLPGGAGHHRLRDEPPPRLFFDTRGQAGPGEPLPEGYQFLVAQLGSDAFHLELKPPALLTAPLRQVKSPAELALLRRAISITCEAQRAAMGAARPGCFEYQLAARIEYQFRERGARGWAFPSIVGSGPNSCLLHYDRYERQVEAGDLVVVDIGAEFGYYAADVTRTLPASGHFSDRQRRVYQIVYQAQEAAFQTIRPGIPVGDVHRVANEVVTAGLIGLGLIKEKAEARKYFPHGTSHGLGLDVHDPTPGPTLAAGMVITVEPGIYIPEEGLGVRIEDDVLVTEKGCEVLSAAAPRSPEEVEHWMGSESL